VVFSTVAYLSQRYVTRKDGTILSVHVCCGLWNSPWRATDCRFSRSLWTSLLLSHHLPLLLFNWHPSRFFPMTDSSTPTNPQALPSTFRSVFNFPLPRAWPYAVRIKLTLCHVHTCYFLGLPNLWNHVRLAEGCEVRSGASAPGGRVRGAAKRVNETFYFCR